MTKEKTNEVILAIKGKDVEEVEKHMLNHPIVKEAIKKATAEAKKEVFDDIEKTYLDITKKELKRKHLK